MTSQGTTVDDLGTNIHNVTKSFRPPAVYSAHCFNIQYIPHNFTMYLFIYGYTFVCNFTNTARQRVAGHFVENLGTINTDGNILIMSGTHSILNRHLCLWLRCSLVDMLNYTGIWIAIQLMPCSPILLRFAKRNTLFICCVCRGAYSFSLRAPGLLVSNIVNAHILHTLYSWCLFKFLCIQLTGLEGLTLDWTVWKK